MPTESRCVLVVEDNPDHALLVRLAAERVDPALDVHVAFDGMNAMEYLSGEGDYADRNRHPLPELVILDLLMPRVDGFGVLEWIRADDRWSDLPVVVLTSSISPEDERRARRLGASAFHTKPADLERLGSLVRAIVGRWLP